MLSFFPEMYPDELLYSVFARYHQLSGNQSVKLSYTELLGYKSEVLCNPVVLPRNLEYLSMQIQEYGISCNKLLYMRTLFPYIYLFSSDSQVKVAEEWAFSFSQGGRRLRETNRDCINTEIGPLKYCPVCLEEEYKTYGEGYWHRHHQIPGVLVCTKHRIVLQRGQNAPRRYWDSFYSLDKSSISSIQNKNTLNTYDMEVAVQLANGIQWITENYESAHKLWMQYSCYFREFYFHLLIKKGFGTKHRVILITQFLRDIVCYYGKILSFLDLTSFKYNNYPWPMGIFLRQSREIEPLLHFLIMQYLSGSIQEFFNQLMYFKSYDFLESPKCNYYFANEPSLFNRDKEKFRCIWKRNFLKHNVNRIDRSDSRTLSAQSWLYVYDYDWLVKNPRSKRNARDMESWSISKEHFSNWTPLSHFPFSIAGEIVCGKLHRWDCPTARFSKEIYIKSPLETITACKKWKSIHRYRVQKKQVSESSAIFEYSIVSAMMDTIEKAPSISGC